MKIKVSDNEYHNLLGFYVANPNHMVIFVNDFFYTDKKVIINKEIVIYRLVIVSAYVVISIVFSACIKN